jgi:CelD/BcsL family acetyltransferase involved in cellulose biosynthesis
MWAEQHMNREAPLDAPFDAIALRLETSDSLECLRRASGGLFWPAPFVLPGWIRAWHAAFGQAELQLWSLRENEAVVGLAPLQVAGRTASLAGSPDVCDHLDLVAAPGREHIVCRALLGHLRHSAAVDRLDTGPVRPDSVVVRALLPAARALGLSTEVIEDESLFELRLPAAWDDYLAALSGKERHEVRRKLRRGGEAFRFELAEGGAAVVEEFLRLFRRNRSDKAAFMDARTEGFFRCLARQLPETRVGLLHVDGSIAAAVWCFDHGRTRYLYNSAYDADYSALSVGLACKLLSIRDAIERGLGTYDFLKGNEAYKHRLGGMPVPLVRCRIDLRAVGRGTS